MNTAHSYPQRRIRRHGFTLLELILVMTLLAILTAMVSPVFRGTLSNMRSENALRDFVATLEYAQTRAITESNEFRLYLTPQQNSYHLERAITHEGHPPSYEPIQAAIPTGDTFPNSVHLASAKTRLDKKAKQYFITFYPNGLCDASTLAFEITDQDALYIVKTSGASIQWTKVKS